MRTATALLQTSTLFRLPGTSTTRAENLSNPNPVIRELDELLRLDPKEMSDLELKKFVTAEMEGYGDNLPIRIEIKRQKCLDSPSFLATEVLDPWYKKHFEPCHYQMLDEVLAPWILGETVRIQGSNFDPKEYTGFIGLWSRSTIKSTMLRILCQWIAIHRKLRLKEDTRTMFCHQVLEKAVEHSGAIRACAQQNPVWRETFPEFSPPAGKEWDTRAKWRWPCFETYQATEYSFTCYGESSSKVGGHYTERIVDDWVTEESVTTELQIQQSHQRLVDMDNLRDRTRPYNPWILAGTHYHFQDAYKRLENQGLWLVWRLPAHTGSPKAIFDLCALEDRTEKGRKLLKKKLRELERNPPGELNFPALLPWEELYRTARTTGANTYNCQMLLNPMPEGEQRFDYEALQNSWVDEIPVPEEMHIYIRCDPAISEKKSADETAIIVGGVKWDGTRWVLDGWIGREKRPTEIVKRCFTLAKKWQALRYDVKDIGIESVQYQEALSQIARYGIPEREPAYSGESVPMLKSPCGVRSIKRSSDMRKHERLLEMDGPITRRELKFWTKCNIAQKVMNQFTNFPFDKFDALDATHDLWVGVTTPSKPMAAMAPSVPVVFQKYLRDMDDNEGPRLVGTNNTVRLTSWGG